MTFFDSHLHIIDPRFPLQANQGYLPAPFTWRDYRRKTAEFTIIGGAIVSGSFQGFDQTYLTHALRKLGPRFVGVTQIPPETTDDAILELHAAGVRAIRFNIRRGGSADLSRLAYLAARVHELAGWHAELYIEAKFLPALVPTLLSLPAVSIDHLGLTKEGFDTLLSLVDRGVKVKATGFGRVDFDVVAAIRALLRVNPKAIISAPTCPRLEPRGLFNMRIWGWWPKRRATTQSWRIFFATTPWNGTGCLPDALRPGPLAETPEAENRPAAFNFKAAETGPAGEPVLDEATADVVSALKPLFRVEVLREAPPVSQLLRNQYAAVIEDPDNDDSHTFRSYVPKVLRPPLGDRTDAGQQPRGAGCTGTRRIRISGCGGTLWAVWPPTIHRNAPGGALIPRAHLY